MGTRWIQWLLDLDRVQLGRDAPLMLRWEHQVPAWLIAFIGLVLVGTVGLIYRRETTTPWKRVPLILLRCAGVALLLTILAHPVLVLQRNREERAQVVMLLDTSRSMARREAYDDESLAASLTQTLGLTDSDQLSEKSRWDLLRGLLLDDDSAAFRALLVRNAVWVCRFGPSMEPIAFFSGADDAPQAAAALGPVEPDGDGSRLAHALRQVLERAQGRRVAAIVLGSDGQATDGTEMRDALEMARDRQVPIYTIRLGGTEPVTDVILQRVTGPDRSFLGDLVPLTVDLSVTGAGEDLSIVVEVTDLQSGRVVSRETTTLTPGDAPRRVPLSVKPERAGRITYRVRATSEREDRHLENNTETIDVQVLEDHLRVLYVDGYPRFEYRYLKNALLREETVELSVLLLEADEEFVQEGTYPIRRFPGTSEELRRFDVLLLGDVDPRGGWLSVSQMHMVVEFVSQDGGGFGLICGPRSTPQRFAGTPLERLVPVVIPSDLGDPTLEANPSGFNPRLTSDGKVSPFFGAVPGTGDATDSAESIEDRFALLPPLYWLARTEGPKPGAVVLAEHPTMEFDSDHGQRRGPMPVIVLAHYGAGRIFLQGTDETWRWRRHVGEHFHDTYWVQVVRELMRGDRTAGMRGVILRADQKVYPYGATVRLTIDVPDERLLERMGQELPLLVLTPESRTGNFARSEGADPQPGSTDSIPEGEPGLNPLVRLSAQRIGRDSRQFEARFVPPGSGRFVARLDAWEGPSGGLLPSVSFRVDEPDTESRRLEADHSLLQHLAEETEGRLIEPAELVKVLETIPDRSVVVPDDVTEPLWDSRLVFILFILIISMEWIMRKSFGLA